MHSKRIEVFDAGGWAIRRLVDPQQEAGSHVVVWNGRDDGRRYTGSGVYFYRLLLEGSTETRKLTRVR